MNKKIILIAIFAIIGILFSRERVYAANPIMSVLPATGSAQVGSLFNVTVQVNPEGNRVCVVKGTVDFNGLSCQSINVSSGLIEQKIPSCNSPSFVLGIPKCTVVTQQVLSVSVRANNIGRAQTSITGSGVISVGILLSSDSESSNYNITPIPAKVSTPPVLVVAPPIAITTTPAPLFDVISTPILPKQPNEIIFIVLSSILEILILLLIFFIIKRCIIYFKEKSKAKKDVDTTQKMQ